MDAKDVKEQKTEPKQTEGQGPKIYKLHRSILYLREQEKEKKQKLGFLKSLK